MGVVGNHEMVSITALGIGTLFLMMAYDTQSMIVESVLHSVSAREPDRIDPHAGYYGQAALYASYTLATLISPWLCYLMGSRWTLVIGSLFFTVYISGFFFLNSVFYYTTQILMGFGFAIYYSAQGMYMAEHSRRGTISRNSALISVIGNAGMCAGGIALYIITAYTPKTTDNFSFLMTNGTTFVNSTETSVAYRHFSDFDIYVLYGAFLAATVLSNTIFGFLPTRQYDSIAQTEKVQVPTWKTQIGLIMDAMREPRILLLMPFFICYGLQVSFMLSAFPTTFAFTETLSSQPYLPAIYSICIGAGNVIMGLYINGFSRKFPSFGLTPTMITQLLWAAATYALIYLATPNMSSIRPTSDETPWLKPNGTLAMIMGLMLGMADGCLCPMRVIVCTLAVPEKKLQNYSVAKLYQSLASCVAFFVSPLLTIQHWMILLTVAQIVSGVTFFVVSKAIARDAGPVGDTDKNKLTTTI